VESDCLAGINLTGSELRLILQFRVVFKPDTPSYRKQFFLPLTITLFGLP